MPLLQRTPPPRRASRAALEDDETRQIVALAPQTVSHPRAHARPPKLSAASVHEQLGGSVIEQLGFAGLDDRQLIHDLGGMGQQVADRRPAVAVLLETPLRRQQIVAVAAIHEGKSLAFGEARRNGLAVQLRELRLVLEHLELRGAARHEQKNHAFGRWSEVGRLGGERVAEPKRRSGCAASGHQRSQCQRSDADAAAAEEMAAGQFAEGTGLGIHNKSLPGHCFIEIQEHAGGAQRIELAQHRNLVCVRLT